MWQCVRNGNCFLVKRNGVQLTSEPGNVMNKNSFKYSGLANERAVDISMDSAGKLSVGLKVPKRKSMPKQSVRTIPLNKNFRAGAHSIKSQTTSACYRSDLADMALARWSALHRLSMVQKGLKKKSKTKLGRGSTKQQDE